MIGGSSHVSGLLPQLRHSSNTKPFGHLMGTVFVLKYAFISGNLYKCAFEKNLHDSVHVGVLGGHVSTDTCIGVLSRDNDTKRTN